MKQQRNQETQSGNLWINPFQMRPAPVPEPTFSRGGSNGKVNPGQIGPVPASRRESLPEPDDWQMDEHWLAVTSYLAEMDFPNEG